MTATRIDRGSTDTTTIYSEGGDLVFERTFDAPRELVWKAFTDPTIIPRWWGPHGTDHGRRRDGRPARRQRGATSARAPDREDVEFYGEYLEVEPPTASSGRSCSMSRASVRRAARRPYTFEDVGAAGRGCARSATSVRPRPSRRAGHRHGQGRHRDLGSPRGRARRGLISAERATRKPGTPSSGARLLCGSTLAITWRSRTTCCGSSSVCMPGRGGQRTPPANG